MSLDPFCLRNRARATMIIRDANSPFAFYGYETILLCAMRRIRLSRGSNGKFSDTSRIPILDIEGKQTTPMDVMGNIHGRCASRKYLAFVSRLFLKKLTKYSRGGLALYNSWTNSKFSIEIKRDPGGGGDAFRYDLIEIF